MRSAVLVIAIVAAAAPAYALPYETFVDVDDEQDLQDLLAAGTIDQDTYDELLDLLQRGVDLNEADRGELYTLPNLTYEDVDAIIAYRDLNKGRIGDPAELVSSGALSEEKLLAISSFLVVHRAGENPLAARGWFRAATRAAPHDFNPYEPSDPLVPPLALRARVVAMRYLTAGVAATNTRLDIGDPIWDPNRGSLVAEPRSNQVHVPKAYLKWETDKLTAIAGTFRAGFGQRLVFDDSQHYNPNGLYLDDQMYYSGDLATACKESQGELAVSPCSGDAGSEYVTPDFNWREGLLGVGLGAKRLELSTGWLQAYGFASLARKSIYQYELVDRDRCKDPHADTDAACAAPNVFVHSDGDPLTPSPRHSFATLPNIFLERLVGGNVTYFADRRSSVGVTAYGASEEDLIDGVRLDRQEWSRVPYGGRYGAIGASFAVGRNWLDVFGEGAYSFDRMNVDNAGLSAAKGGGGPAGILRMTATRKKEELELVGRYYSTDYANPYSRPISASDEFEGQRARDEIGGRARYTRVEKDLEVVGYLDVWTAASETKAVKIDARAGAKVRTTPWLQLSLLERYQDKDLSQGGHDQCYEISTETDMNGEPVPCAGRQITTYVGARYEPTKWTSTQVLLQHQLVDDNARMELKTKFRQDIAAWLLAYWRPTPNMRLRGRVRYLDEGIHDNTYLERSIAAYGDVSTRVRDKDSLRVRIDAKFWLDQRMSTVMRVPNPELALWLFYEARL